MNLRNPFNRRKRKDRNNRKRVASWRRGPNRLQVQELETRRLLAGVSGFVYLDTDGDGARDTTEMGVPGAVIALTGTDGLGDAVVRSALTDQDGAYHFDNLPAGVYQINETQPAALVDGADSTTAPGATAGNDVLSNIALAANTNFANNNFGERSLRGEYLSIVWFFASSGSHEEMLRETIAVGEERAGNASLAAAIRRGDTVPPDGAVNRAPVALADDYDVAAGGTLTVGASTGILANDVDADGDSLTANVISGPANGALTLNDNGSFTYTPDAGFNGVDEFIYAANDGQANSAPATVTISVDAVNNRPTTQNDSYQVQESDVLTVSAASGVLANDTDADGDSLTAAVANSPSNGTLVLNSDGSFTYTPDDEFHGEDSFTYTASDGSLTSTQGTVIITVVSDNTAPTAEGDSYTTEEDAPLVVNASLGVLTNDTDADGDDLTAVVVAGPGNGTLSLSANGSFTYTPDADFVGTDTFTYTANDAETASTAATVTITVTGINDAPVGVADEYSVAVNGELTVNAAGGALANDTDPDGDSLTASLVSDAANGSLTFNSDGSFSYTPDADFQGEDSFTYRASDGALTSEETTVTIFVNSAPVAADDAYDAVEDTPLVIDSEAGLLANDTDADGDSLTVSLVDGPTNGELTLNADGSFTYTPSANFNGTDTFTYMANDGLEDSATATVTITVADTNDAPTAVDDTYSAPVNGTLSINATAGVLANDDDMDGDTLTAELVDSPENGALTFNADGSFTYTPEAGFHGSDTFTYFANDGSLSSETATVTILVNDAPATMADEYETLEDTPLVVGAATGVLANDEDDDDDPLTTILVAPPSFGELTLNADGSFTYTPDANFNGTDGFSYVANDGLINSATTFVTILVNSDNDVPMPMDDTYSVSVNTELSVDADAGVLNNDSDVDGDSLSAQLIEMPAHGTITLETDGSFVYTPDANFHGADSFTYRASDGTVLSGEATVTIFVNDAPSTVNDSYATEEDTPLTVDAASGVLENDSDVDGDHLTVELGSGPQSGEVTLNADGSFTYTPSANFTGIDSFTYVANDGFVDSSPTTVTITVSGENDAPAAIDDTYQVSVDGELTVDAGAGVLDNDSDAEGDALSVQLVSSPANGTLTLNADGSFTYTPDTDFHGADTFTYTASDGALSSTEATVTIFVNDDAVAEDDSYQTDEDVSLTVDAGSGVLANDSDIDGDDLTASLTGNPVHGELTFNSDGSFAYTPNENFTGTDQFTYAVSDGFTESAPATVTIEVNSVNDAPVAVDDVYDVSVDGVLTLTDASGVLANDLDPEGDDLTAAVVTEPASGELVFNEDGSFTYTPEAGFHGVDSFTYTVSDGEFTSAEATVTIRVNDLPTTADDNYTVTEDETLTVDAASGVLANDSDADADTLTAALLDGPANGAVTLASDGSFTYTPGADFSGTDTFTYTVNDGIADSAPTTVTIVVEGVNDAPVAGDDTYHVLTDRALTVDAASGVLANDNDADGDTLTAQIVADPANGSLILRSDGSFVYTPDEGFSGSDTFTYLANDDESTSQIATVTVVVNDPPAVEDDSFEIDEGESLTVDAAAGVLANDADPNGDTLMVSLAAGPQSGAVTLAADGSFVYTPNENFSGTDSFTYIASDGLAESDEATVTITVAEVNDAPIAVDDHFSVSVNGELEIDAALGLLSNDSDVEGDSLSAAISTGPANGELVLNADGSFTYTPDEDFHGADTFTYTVSDGELSSEATVTIVVNDAPGAMDDTYDIAEDTPLTIDAALGVLANDTDVDGDDITVTLAEGPSNGELTLHDDGSFTYVPTSDFVGADTFTYVANDGFADSAPATVSITVTAVNDAPVAVDDVFSVAVNEVLDIDAEQGVLLNDIDVDGDSLTAQLVNSPSSGSVSFNEDGSFTYTPNADFHGADTFTYTVSDGELTSEEATATILVNSPAVATDDQYATDEDIPVTVGAAAGLLANDTDADADPLTAVLVDAPESGEVTLNADGSFTYTPDADFHGEDTFTYAANDGLTDSAPATVTIVVQSFNDAPMADGETYEVSVNGELDVEIEAGVLANGVDADGDALTAELTDMPENGTIVFNADGSFSYTPDADFHGVDTFAYTVSDGVLTSAKATATILVNDPATVVNDAYETNEDELLVIDGAAGVLANDSDVDGDDLTVTLLEGPANGEVTLNADGSFSYTPGADFSGEDTFVYTANDGFVDSSAATVSISVAAVNDAPEAEDDTYSVSVNGQLSIAAAEGVLLNDADVERDSLTAQLGNMPNNGSVTLNQDGSFSYTPDTDFHGVDSFTYTSSDGDAASNEATINIFVNGLPVLEDDTYSTNQGEALLIDAVTGVLANDTDPDGDSLTVTILDSPTGGEVTLQADGAFTYTPSAEFVGVDTFAYVANDGLQDSAPAVVTITVNAAPEAMDDIYNVSVNGALTVDAETGVLANDSDLNEDELTAQLVSMPSGGTVEVNADGSFTYTPDMDFHGEDTFVYNVSDGALTSANATVTIFVNDLPVATDDEYQGDEGVALTIDAVAGLLANDTDADGDPLSAELVEGPAGGEVTIQSDGSFTYTPTAGFSGVDSFTYRVNDGLQNSATATVSVEVNAAPTAADDAYDVPVNDSVSIDAASGVLANDSDAEMDDLTVSLVTAPANGTVELNADGSFSYTPDADFHGADSFTYTASDGVLSSNEATVVLIVNQPPAVTDDSYQVDEEGALTVDAASGVLANDTDADGDALTVTLAAGPASGELTLQADGSFVYAPHSDFSGTDSFTYIVNDGFTDSSVATATITVDPINDAPQSQDDAYSVSVDGELVVAMENGVLSNDSDVDGDELTAQLMVVPSGGVVTLNADGSFTYTPNEGFHGADTFTYTTSDGQLTSAEATVTITVNDPPTASDDHYAAEEGSTLELDSLAGVLANDDDIDGDSLAAMLITAPLNGEVTLNEDGSLAYTPNDGFTGTDEFTYAANDGLADSSPATVTIEVQLSNDAPASGEGEPEPYAESVDAAFEEGVDWLSQY